MPGCQWGKNTIGYKNNSDISIVEMFLIDNTQRTCKYVHFGLNNGNILLFLGHKALSNRQVQHFTIINSLCSCAFNVQVPTHKPYNVVLGTNITLKQIIFRSLAKLRISAGIQMKSSRFKNSYRGRVAWFQCETQCSKSIEINAELQVQIAPYLLDISHTSHTFVMFLLSRFTLTLCLSTTGSFI